MIQLKLITEENFEECVGLKVADCQQTFVAPNVRSLAEAWLYPHLVYPFAIYADDSMVGFVMMGNDEGKYWICRFMIDEKYQNKGYGKDALKLSIQYLIETHKVNEIYLSFEPENDGANQLYRLAGFRETGEVLEGEIVMKLVAVS